MADFFDEINSNFNKELISSIIKLLKDPNNKLADNLTKIINDPKISIAEIIDKFSSNKKDSSKSESYVDVDNISESNINLEKDYDDLLHCLQNIEKNMNLIENYIKD